MDGFPGGSDGKASAYNVGYPGLIPGSGRSPGEGNGNPLQDSCLANPMDGGAWWATVHGGREESDTTERLHFTSFSKDATNKGLLSKICIQTAHTAQAQKTIQLKSRQNG